MILKVYAIRDEKTGYLTPTVDQNDAAAMRSFSHACKSVQSLFYTHPADYTLMRIGEYDSDTGLISACAPEPILCATDVKKGE